MAQIIQVGKRQWLAGMEWLSLEEAPDKTELAAHAARKSAQWSCLRVSRAAIQAGFSGRVDGKKNPKRLYSIAAMVADSREQPWLGIFKIKEGLWWYVAVRDGNAILPDGDVIGGREEIHAARERHTGYGDWKYIEGDIEFLEKFIQGIEAKPTPIKDVNPDRASALKMAIGAGVLISVAAGGFYWYEQRQKELDQQQSANMAALRAKLKAGQPIVVAPSPLLSTPAPNDWLKACGAVIGALPLSYKGWAIDLVSCDARAVLVSWSRQPGATIANRPDGDLSGDDLVGQSIPLSGLSVSGIDNAIELKTSSELLRSWAQFAGFKIVGATLQPTVVALPGGENKTPAFKADNKMNFKFDTVISPFDLDMSAIPGLRLNKVSSTINGWSVEGILYGK